MKYQICAECGRLMNAQLRLFDGGFDWNCDAHGVTAGIIKELNKTSARLLPELHEADEGLPRWR